MLSLNNLLNGFDAEYSADRDMDSMFESAYKEADRTFLKGMVYATEQNSLDAGKLLDRIISYRNEINLLEAERIKTKLAYENIASLSKNEMGIELLKDSRSNPRLRRAIKAKHQTTMAYIRDLERRHGADGSPINFTQRREKLRALARRDIDLLAIKLLAIERKDEELSLNQIDHKPPKPGKMKFVSFDGASHIDDLLAWHRDFSRRLENKRRDSTTHEFVWSLGKPAVFRTHFHENQIFELVDDLSQSVVNTTGIFFQIGSGLTEHRGDYYGPDYRKIEFSVSDCDMTDARIEAIAVSVTTGRPDDWRFNIAIRLPSYSEVHLTARPSNSYPNWFSDSTIHGRRPGGTWRLIVESAFSCTGDPGQAEVSTWPIVDIAFHIRMSVRSSER